MTEREKIAYLIAFWHGSKITLVHNGAHTIASQRGYGKWDDAATCYAQAHLREYLQAADAVIRHYNPDYIG